MDFPSWSSSGKLKITINNPTPPPEIGFIVPSPDGETENRADWSKCYMLHVRWAALLLTFVWRAQFEHTGGSINNYNQGWKWRPLPDY